MLDNSMPTPRDLVRYAYRKVEAEREAFLRIVAIPAFLKLLIISILSWQEPSGTAFMIALGLSLIPETLFYVAWLRRVLNADLRDPLLPYRWTNRHTGVLGRMVALCLIASVVFLPAAFLHTQVSSGFVYLLFLANGAAAFYVVLRSSLFLVARAIDFECNIMQSWTATRDGSGRFFWGAAFAFLPLMVVLGILNSIVEGVGLADALPLVTMLTMIVINYIADALLLAVIAHAYEIRMTGYRSAEF